MYNLSKFAETFDYLIFELNNKQKTDAKSIAKQLGVGASTITRYLSGERVPSVENLVLLADYFKCTADFLLGLEDENYFHTFKQCPKFSEQFCKVLKQYGYNCYRFSEEIEIHQSTVYAWKNGKRMPSLDHIIKMAEFFDCSVDYILGRE